MSKGSKSRVTDLKAYRENPFWDKKEETVDIRKELESLKLHHKECEDPWYSCPKHPEGCANDGEGDECNCGADEHNAKIDEIISLICI